MKRNTPYVYTICRIDSKYWQGINDELKERGYNHIKCYVPTVQILKKSRDKKNHFNEVPMLFNYGFVRMKSELAYDRNFLIKLRKEITGINSFVKSLDYMHPKRLKRRVDNAEDFDDFSKVATITKAQFRYYKKISRTNKVYSLSDIKVEVGEYVTLRKYPFEGLLAKVIDFNFSNQTAIVEIYPGQGSVLSLQLPFENVIYTVYDGYDDEQLLPGSRVDLDSLTETEEPIDEINI